MKLYRLFYWAVAVIVLTSCNSQENQSQSQADRDRKNQSQKAVTLDKNFKIVMGQTIVVDSSDTSGGLGANFIVEWVAQTEVSEPVVEAVLISSEFHQGISWISPGKVIKSQPNRKPSASVPGS